METFSTPEHPGWQDITFELIESKIDAQDFKNALFLCKLRKTALEGALQDIKQLTSSTDRLTQQNELELNAKDWKKEQKYIQEEISQLDVYIMDIQARLQTK